MADLMVINLILLWSRADGRGRLFAPQRQEQAVAEGPAENAFEAIDLDRLNAVEDLDRGSLSAPVGSEHGVEASSTQAA